MMRNKFDEQLTRLHRELTEMGALCEHAIAMAAKSLTGEERELYKDIFSLENEINQKESEIESLCLKLLLQQQPVAKDLRQISSALKMITDMERIGDHASDIAEILPFMTDRENIEFDVIADMAEAAVKMVTDSIEAYVKRNLELARSVILCDDVVDGYFNDIRKRIIALITENPADGEYVVDILMIAKYFERIADHATNIAEWAEFSVTGVHELL